MTSSASPRTARSALARLAALHEAWADPARLRLLNLLAGGELCVCDLVDLTGESQPFVSRHLARLRSAGLVTVGRRGKFAYYGLATLGGGEQLQLDALLRGLPALAGSLKRDRAAATVAATRRAADPCR